MKQRLSKKEPWIGGVLINEWHEPVNEGVDTERK
jgi:hypothetical protein